MLRFCKWLLLCFAMLSEGGRSAPLPDVLGHTPLKVVANRGDKVVFAVALTGELGEGSAVRWYRYETPICEDLACTLETYNLGLGEHKITMTLEGPWGTKSLVFRLSLMASPPGYRATTIEPDIEMLATTTIDVGQADLYLQAPLGRGFVRRGRLVYPITVTRQPLVGAREIRCQSNCLVRFGKMGVEEQVLLPKSTVSYVVTGDGRRIYDLQKGAIRSRKLTPLDADWTIVLGRHLQIDPGKNADFLVGMRPSRKQALITVLRGEVRIVRSVRGPQGDWKRDELTLPQGVFVKLPLGQLTPVEFAHPPVKQIQNLFTVTSPQYIGLEKGGWQGDVLSALPNNTNVLMEQRDYLGAIQVITSAEYASWTPEQRMMLAKSYAGIFQYDRAKQVLGQMVAEGEVAAGFHELKATIAMAEQRWEDAKPDLKDALGETSTGAERLYYYSGVTESQLGNSVRAETAFKHALWVSEDRDIRNSAQQYLADIDRHTWARMAFEFGLLHEVNVTRGRREGEVNSQPGHGVNPRLLLDWRLVQEERVKFSLEAEATYTTWLQAGLEDYSELSTVVRAPLVAGVGGKDRETAFFAFGLTPLTTYVSWGETAPYEAVGADVWMGSPAIWGLRTILQTRVMNDVGLNQLETFDPILLQPSDATDRTNKSLAVGLGVSPIRSETWDLQLEMLQRTLTYRAAESHVDNHTALVTNAHLAYLPSYRWQLQLSFATESRQFDHRDETYSIIGMDITWYLTPNYRFSLRAGVERQTSSDEEAGYDRSHIGLWSGFEL